MIAQTESLVLAHRLKSNQDVFACSHEDMPGINPSIMVCHFNVSSSFPPIRRKESLHKRERERERERAIAKEVFKLLEVDFIKEVYYSNWLANVVMV